MFPSQSIIIRDFPDFFAHSKRMRCRMGCPAYHLALRFRSGRQHRRLRAPASWRDASIFAAGQLIHTSGHKNPGGCQTWAGARPDLPPLLTWPLARSSRSLRRRCLAGPDLVQRVGRNPRLMSEDRLAVGGHYEIRGRDFLHRGWMHHHCSCCHCTFFFVL